MSSGKVAPLVAGARWRWPDLLFLVLASAVVGWVADDAFSTRIITDSRGADYWEHTATLRALMESPFHPRHPHVASTDWSPRFGPHFLLVALVGRALHLDPLDAAGVASVLNVVLLMAGIYLFFRTYFQTPLASLYGLVVMLGSWLDSPHFSNVYKLRILFSVASYPSTAALGISLLGFTLALRVLRREQESRPLLGLLCLTWAYLYLTHPLTAMMGLVGALLLAATEPSVSLRRRALVAGTVALGVSLTLLWPYYPALRMVAGGTAEQVQQGLETEAHAHLHPFYATPALFGMLGLATLGVLPFPYFLWKKKHLFVVLGACAMLAPFVANVFLRIPLGHRFILLAIFFFQVGLVWLLLWLTPNLALLLRGPRRPLAALRLAAVLTVLGIAVVANVTSAAERVDRSSTRDSPTVRYGRAVARQAGVDAIVMARAETAWALPTFGPRVLVMHHGNQLLSDGAARERAVRRFYAPETSAAERDKILTRYHVTHVIVEGRRRGSLERFLDQRGEASQLPLGDRLYTLRTGGSS